MSEAAITAEVAVQSARTLRSGRRPITHARRAAGAAGAAVPLVSLHEFFVLRALLGREHGLGLVHRFVERSAPLPVQLFEPLRVRVLDLLVLLLVLRVHQRRDRVLAVLAILA